MIEQRFGATLCPHGINRAACFKCTGKSPRLMDRENDEESNKCPGCGNDRMTGHKQNCPEPLAHEIGAAVEDLLG